MKIIELTKQQFKNYSAICQSKDLKQTTEFADLKGEENFNSIYLAYINDDNDILAGTLIIWKKINNKYRYGYAPHGFLIDYNDKEIIINFTKDLKEYLKKENFIYLRTNPQIASKTYDKHLNIVEGNEKTINILKLCNYVNVGYKDDFSKYIAYLKTNDDINITYESFSRRIKRNITQCLRAGITVYKGKNENFELFTNLIQDNSAKKIEYYRKIQSYYNTDYNKFEMFFAKLNPSIYITNFQYLLKKEEEKNTRLSNKLKKNSNNNSVLKKKMSSDKLVEKYKKEIIKATNIYKKYPDGIILGTCGIIRNNNEILFLVDGYSKEINDIYSINLIKWEIIKIYHSLGYRNFNLGPIHKIINNKDYKGLLLSKLGFNSEILDMPGSYDLIINKYLYPFYTNIINTNKK